MSLLSVLQQKTNPFTPQWRGVGMFFGAVLCICKALLSTVAPVQGQALPSPACTADAIESLSTRVTCPR